MEKQRITIVGAGFAALTAVRKLRALGSEAEVTLVAPRAEFVYLPGLIWIPSALRHPRDLLVSLAPFFERMDVRHLAAEATGLTEGGRVLQTSAGALTNDALLIASGGRFLKKLPGIEHAVTPCEGVNAALTVRERLAGLSGGTIAVGFAGNPNEPAAMRGGPMFEFLFGIDTLLRRQKRRDRFKLLFFNPAPEPGKRLGPQAVKGLLRAMAERGIETHLGHKLKGFAAEKVLTEGGELAADLILFMPGMTGNTWFDNTPLPRSPGGLIQADAHCRVPTMERVYVAGDAGSFPGPEWMPKQAHMAVLQAQAAVKNLLGDLKGEKPRHTFKVELTCIVDTLDKGMLVRRTPERSLVLPPSRIGHWSKRLFEGWYLQRFR